jgi:exonuclease VII large subunit
LSDPRDEYESQTPIRLTIQGIVLNQFTVALEAAVDGADPDRIDATLDTMRRAFIRQETVVKMTDAMESLRQAEFQLANIDTTLALKRRQAETERAELVAGFHDVWASSNYRGEMKMNGNQRGNLKSLEDRFAKEVAELETMRDSGLPLQIKNLKARVADYTDLINHKDKYQVIERRFAEDALRPYDVPVPEAAE